MTTKNDIVAEARTWLGTRFHHQGRVRKTATHPGGCDCIGLVVGVVRDLQIPSKQSGKFLHQYDYKNYSRLPDGKLFREMLEKYLTEIPIDETQPGDVLLFRFEKDPQHIAIVSDYKHGGLGLIHCYASSRKVVEHVLDDGWRNRMVAAFEIL